MYDLIHSLQHNNYQTTWVCGDFVWSGSMSRDILTIEGGIKIHPFCSFSLNVSFLSKFFFYRFFFFLSTKRQNEVTPITYIKFNIYAILNNWMLIFFFSNVSSAVRNLNIYDELFGPARANDAKRNNERRRRRQRPMNSDDDNRYIFKPKNIIKRGTFSRRSFRTRPT